MGHGWEREEGQGNEGTSVGEKGTRVCCGVGWEGVGVGVCGKKGHIYFVLGPLSKS